MQISHPNLQRKAWFVFTKKAGEFAECDVRLPLKLVPSKMLCMRVKYDVFQSKDIACAESLVVWGLIDSSGAPVTFAFLRPRLRAAHTSRPSMFCTLDAHMVASCSVAWSVVPRIFVQVAERVSLAGSYACFEQVDGSAE